MSAESPSELAPNWRVLEAIYGTSFLRFAIAFDGAESTLTPGQEAAMSALDALASASNGQEPFGRYVNLRLQLGQYVPEFGTSISWALRQQSGGDFPEIEHVDDELAFNLLIAARDVWPAFLLQQSAGDDTFGVGSVSAYSNPAAQRAMSLFLKDDAFKRLFPGGPVSGEFNPAEVRANIHSSTGRINMGMQLALFPDVLIGAAWSRHLLGGDASNLAGYLESVLAVLSEARSLARGEEVQVPNLVGLANMEIADGIEIVTPFGTLRSLRDADRQLLLGSPSGGTRPTAVLQVNAPMRLLGIHDRDSNDEIISLIKKRESLVEENRERIEFPIEMIRFALLLSSDETNILAPAPVSRTLFEPFQSGLAQSWMLFVGQPSGSSKLGLDDVEKVRSWADRIRDSPPDKLMLGVRRLVNAAATRTDPVDGFIDAIICWENMFGAAPETTFRVCGAIACIIEPTDRTKRIAMFEQLKKLYVTRSKVVHGSIGLDVRTAYDSRARALWYAVVAMRMLYRHPHLLAKRSHDRGRDVLLDCGFSSDPMTEQGQSSP